MNEKSEENSCDHNDILPTFSCFAALTSPWRRWRKIKFSDFIFLHNFAHFFSVENRVSERFQLIISLCVTLNLPFSVRSLSRENITESTRRSKIISRTRWVSEKNRKLSVSSSSFFSRFISYNNRGGKFFITARPLTSRNGLRKIIIDYYV